MLMDVSQGLVPTWMFNKTERISVGGDAPKLNHLADTDPDVLMLLVVLIEVINVDDVFDE